MKAKLLLFFLLLLAIALSGCTETPLADTPPITCTESWTCGGWGTCSDRSQARICTDSKNCGTVNDRPAVVQSCEVDCTEDWDCTAWSDCEGEQKIRTCTDSSNCGTENNRPNEIDPCGESCIEDWSCTAWGDCDNGAQSRICLDSSECGSTVNRPLISQSCEIACTETWTCDNWSACISGSQTRSCLDLSECGTTETRPSISQACETVCVENWSCDSWSACVNESQTRTCSDSSACGTTASKPSTSQNCAADECSTHSDCDDGNPCTTDTCSRFAPKQCVNQEKTACTSDDGCCLPACSETDNDCGTSDLVISSVSPDLSSLDFNEAVELSVTVNNNGDGPAVGFITINLLLYYPQGNPVISLGFTGGALTTISPGASEAFPLFNSINPIYQGEYTFEFVVDKGDRIPESNENNNTYSETVNIS